ncbi:uncharacterized protein EI90DRAFT_2216623 [Cantharellus anzutake]|uniref:uncharacterized protein n=1 Tax=Cantharellus anzutake TaxID=1750568 RepID=UPI001905543A|nr:uncharacterized protein EI90DRAFT_2216623 [Cantharellus anzutake]KAF8324874.1 hypothetical protein EI90DRAFT_2216623 [Cantharellus anzutake]
MVTRKGRHSGSPERFFWFGERCIDISASLSFHFIAIEPERNMTMTSKAPTSFRCIGSGNARARPTVLPKFATSHHGRPFDVATQLGSTPHFLNGCCPSCGFGRDFVDMLRATRTAPPCTTRFLTMLTNIHKRKATNNFLVQRVTDHLLRDSPKT